MSSVYQVKIFTWKQFTVAVYSNRGHFLKPNSMKNQFTLLLLCLWNDEAKVSIYLEINPSKIIQRVSIKYLCVFISFKFLPLNFEQKKLLIKIGIIFFIFFDFGFITTQLAIIHVLHCLLEMSYRLNFIRHRHPYRMWKKFILFLP